MEQHRQCWMSSEAAFLRVEAMLVLPHRRARYVRLRGLTPVSTVGFDQLLRACRKNGLKSKG